MEPGAIGISVDSLPAASSRRAALAARASAMIPRDPRILQIAFLGSLLAAGAYFRDFSLRPEQIVLTFIAALSTQRLLDRLTRKPAPSLLSASITALSLTLLLRADSLWALPAAAVFAIASKFALRIRGKHLFNPANFGVGAALLILPGTWISPGQWGNDVALAGWLVVLGATVAQARGARGHQLALPDLLSRRAGCARGLAGSAMGCVDSSAKQRRAAAVRVLHDFRSDDHAEPSQGPRRARRDGCGNRLRVGFRTVPHQRGAVGAVCRRPDGGGVGRLMAGAQFRLDGHAGKHHTRGKITQGRISRQGDINGIDDIPNSADGFDRGFDIPPRDPRR